MDAPPEAGIPRLLIEGPPGSGKTTAVLRAVELLRARGLQLAGFVTRELRRGGRRTGFAVEGLGGARAVLAHVGLAGDVSVGRYGVDVAAFERVALPELAREADVLVIDEIGRMELASASFASGVERLFASTVPVLATVQARAHPFTDALKRFPGVEVLRLCAANRDHLPGLVAARLVPGTGGGSGSDPAPGRP